MTSVARTESPKIIRLRQKPLVDAVWLGALIWVVVAAAGGLTLANLILLLAVLVIVPLGLDLIHAELADDLLPGQIVRFCQQAQFPAAMFLLAGILIGRGFWPAILALPWMALTLLSALAGALHLATFWRETGRLPPAELAGLDLGLVFISIGGVWTMLYLTGRPMFRYSDAIVQLTAIHFHYVGFALPIIAAEIARAAGRRLIRSLVWIQAAATLSLAVGITVSPLVELVAALTLVAAIAVLAGKQLQVAIACKQPSILTLLGLSSVSLAAGILLAAVYAIGEYRQQRWLEIADMIPLHGILMSAGFSLPGILGWKLWSYTRP